MTPRLRATAVTKRFRKRFKGRPLTFADILYKYIDQHEANLDPEHPSDFTGYFLMEKKRGNFAFDVSFSCNTTAYQYICAKYFNVYFGRTLFG